MGGELRRRLGTVWHSSPGDHRLVVVTGVGVGFVLLTVWLAMTVVYGHLGFFRPSDDGYYYYDLVQGVTEGRGLSTDGIHTTNGFHPLWFVVLLPFGVLTTGPVGLVVTAQVLSILLLAAAVSGVVATARRLGAGRLAAVVGGLALTFAPWRNVAAAGVEGALALALLSWLVYAAIHAAEASPVRVRPWAVSGLLAGLTMLARLDTVFVVGTVVLALLLTALRWWPGRPEQDCSRSVGLTVALLVPPLALVGGYLVINTVATGSPMPITASLKSSFPEPGLSVAFLRSNAAYYVALVPAWLAVAVALAVPRFRRHLAVLFAAAAGASLFGVYLALFGEGVFWWHFVSLLPAGALGVALVLDWCLDRTAIRERSASAQGLAAATAAAVLVVPLVVSIVATNPDGERAAASGWRVEAHRAGSWAGAHLPDDSLLAMKDSGAFGHYTSQPVMNLDGVVSDRDYNQRICDGTALDEMREAGVEYVAQHSVPPDYDTFEVALPCWERGDRPSRITLSRQEEVYRGQPYWHGGADRIFVIWAFEDLED